MTTDEILSRCCAVADAVLERCRDRYGGEHTPLFVDGLDPTDGRPLEWEGHTLSNLACQQNFLRSLQALTTLTGNSVYLERAREWISHALRVLRDPASDLLYWGGHTSFDLGTGRPLLGNHELKCVYPDYCFLYGVAPETMRRFAAAFWQTHMVDWSSLLFNRHGEYEEWDRAGSWTHEYRGGSLPIVENRALSFINTGSDLIYAAAKLHALEGEERPLEWAGRLLSRYEEIRHPDTGLGGYQFNHREPCRVRASFKKPLGDRVDVNETTVLNRGYIGTRFGRVAVTWLNLYEELGEVDEDRFDDQDLFDEDRFGGAMFRDMVVRDLRALTEYSWDGADHSFSPVLNDGTKLSPEDVEDVAYCPPQKLEKLKANGLMFLAYARAYRLTGEEDMLGMAAQLAAGMWGEGDLLGEEIDFSGNDGESGSRGDAFGLMGVLDLYEATGSDCLMASATSLGAQLIAGSEMGSFIGDDTATAGPVSIDSLLPLALLHLVAAHEGGRAHGELPVFYPGVTVFDPKVVIARRKRSG